MCPNTIRKSTITYQVTCIPLCFAQYGSSCTDIVRKILLGAFQLYPICPTFCHLQKFGTRLTCTVHVCLTQPYTTSRNSMNSDTSPSLLSWSPKKMSGMPVASPPPLADWKVCWWRTHHIRSEGSTRGRDKRRCPTCQVKNSLSFSPPCPHQEIHPSERQILHLVKLIVLR